MFEIITCLCEITISSWLNDGDLSSLHDTVQLFPDFSSPWVKSLQGAPVQAKLTYNSNQARPMVHVYIYIYIYFTSV